jgi:uncharacterized protein YodC (DUF2158 family)
VEHQFKEGDVVSLKSGGPTMTIEGIGTYGYSTREKAFCVWFEGTKKHDALFELSSLTPVNTQATTATMVRG